MIDAGFTSNQLTIRLMLQEDYAVVTASIGKEMLSAAAAPSSRLPAPSSQGRWAKKAKEAGHKNAEIVAE
jgi:hypothetical protein